MEERGEGRQEEKDRIGELRKEEERQHRIVEERGGETRLR